MRIDTSLASQHAQQLFFGQMEDSTFRQLQLSTIDFRLSLTQTRLVADFPRYIFRADEPSVTVIVSSYSRFKTRTCAPGKSFSPARNAKNSGSFSYTRSTSYFRPAGACASCIAPYRRLSFDIPPNSGTPCGHRLSRPNRFSSSATTSGDTPCSNLS